LRELVLKNDGACDVAGFEREGTEHRNMAPTRLDISAASHEATPSRSPARATSFVTLLDVLGCSGWLAVWSSIGSRGPPRSRPPRRYSIPPDAAGNSRS